MYLRIEIDVMARLNHPFLVNLNYSFQTPHAAFMVLDLVSGAAATSSCVNDATDDTPSAAGNGCSPVSK